MPNDQNDRDDRPGHAAAATRRQFIQSTGLAAGLLVAPPFMLSARGYSWQEGSALFATGVASGDPDDDSVVLWTRLVDDPLAAGTGLGDRVIPVTWEVALDPGMRHVVRRGTTQARIENGHAVRVLARGLPRDQWLYYRFVARGRYNGQASRIGRTRTFPGASARGGRWSRWLRGEPCRTEEMRFAFVSCQNYVQGSYPAWGDIARQDLDFVIHTGDYIYEGGASSNPLIPGRNHNGGEIFSVEEYRSRYALYRLDANLQDAHAQFPFIVTWDDHEVDNNYAALIAEEGAPFQGDEFIERRRNAYRVYGESMPIRTISRPGRRRSERFSEAFPLFRRLRFGRLADIHVLDTRQYRTDQPAGDNFGSTDTAVDPAIAAVLEAVFGEELFDAAGTLDPKATLLGLEQEAWLASNLARSRAKWNVLAQQIMVMPWNLRETGRLNLDLTLPPGQVPGVPFPLDKGELVAAAGNLKDLLNVDAWDGYPAARERLFRILEKTGAASPVVVTGDIHSSWGANLYKDFTDPANSDVLAVEFVGTSIASTFLAPDPRPTDFIVRAGLPLNPHIRYFNGRFRGYVMCEVDEHEWKTTYRAVGEPQDLADPDPLALVPQEGDPVFTDAIATVRQGFNRPGQRDELAFSGVLTGYTP